MAKQKWEEQEKSILSNNISDGMLVSEMCKLIPSHPESGIVKLAQSLNFGIKTKNGVTKFYANKKTRNRTKKSATIVGTKRATTNNSTPTISERTNQNLSDAIVTDNTININRDSLIAIYDDISALLECKNYTAVKSITVDMDTAILTLLKKGVV